MKFWELYSVLGRAGVRSSELPRDEKWSRYRTWWDAFDKLVRDQDRAILDHELEQEFVLAALALAKEPCFLDGTWLRAGPPGERLTAVEVAARFGGSVIEEVQEKGSFDVRSLSR